MPVDPVQWVRASGPLVLLCARYHISHGSNGHVHELIFKRCCCIFNKLSMQCATSCFNYDQWSKLESCWIEKCAPFISQLARPFQSSSVQWLEGNWAFSCVIPLWSTLLVMNVRKKVTEITDPPKAHGSSIAEDTFFCFAVVHHSTDPCPARDQNEGTKLISRHSMTKVYTPYQTRARWVKEFLGLQRLVFDISYVTCYPQQRERSENSNDLIKSPDLDTVLFWVRGTDFD